MTTEPLDPRAHWAQFTDFCIHELAGGGPDPHMRYVTEFAYRSTWDEGVWLAGIYAAGVYNAPTAEVIWRHWPYEKAAADLPGMAAWIREHWAGLRLRRERRAIRTPAKLAGTLSTYAEWARDAAYVFNHLHRDPERAYEEMWAEAMSLPGVGRYAGFKLLEALARLADFPIRLPDLRPAGGWSPRQTLALLDPLLCREEAHDNRWQAMERAEAVAEPLRAQLSETIGAEVDRYRFEVFLCDYRQSYEGKRQYPGRSVDSEVDYHDAITGYWEEHGGHETALWAARTALTPEWARGEATGAWRGVRDDLGPVLASHGYTWSDWLFEYPTDLADPTRKETYDPEALRAMARATLDAWPH